MRALIIASALLAAPASAQQNPTCKDFQRNPDGSWSPTRPVTIQDQNGGQILGPGMSFHPGVLFMGVDLAATLDQQCGKARRP
jgi:hypothetical protein